MKTKFEEPEPKLNECGGVWCEECGDCSVHDWEGPCYDGKEHNFICPKEPGAPDENTKD